MVDSKNCLPRCNQVSLFLRNLTPYSSHLIGISSKSQFLILENNTVEVISSSSYQPKGIQVFKVC